MIFKQYGLYLESDFEIRILREDEVDIDFIIPLDHKTIDLHLCDIPLYIENRIQFPMIKNIIIRLSKLEGNTSCTVHFLKNIDLYSAVVNFEVNYKDMIIRIHNLEYSVAFCMEKSLNN